LLVNTFEMAFIHPFTQGAARWTRTSYAGRIRLRRRSAFLAGRGALLLFITIGSQRPAG